jgi:hypothetical protein
MKTILALIALALAWNVSANWFGGDEKVDSNEQLAKLFGAHKAFTGTAEITVLNKRGKTEHTAEMEYAFLEGKMRTELNMAKTKAGQKHAAGVEEMAAMGMDRMVTLARPDQKRVYLIYPGLQAYCEMPDHDGGDNSQPPKIEKEELGKETVEGHPCVKSRVTITDEQGRQSKLTVWQATDLKEFPIKSEMKEGGNTIVTVFKNVQFTQPAASLFEPPTGFRKYASVQEMMMGAMQKMMGEQFGR